MSQNDLPSGAIHLGAICGAYAQAAESLPGLHAVGGLEGHGAVDGNFSGGDEFGEEITRLMREELAESAIETQPMVLLADRGSEGLSRFLSHFLVRGGSLRSDEIARSVV